MKKTKPITELRDTGKLEEDLSLNNGTLAITKNGKVRFHVLSPEAYEEFQNKDQTRGFEERIEPLPSGDGKSDCLGFVRMAAATPFVNLGAPEKNAENIVNEIRKAHEQGVSVLALPELCLTGYTCGDLFLDDELLRSCDIAIAKILDETRELPILFVFGAPFRPVSRLYNCGFVCLKGKILGIVPKAHLPNYSEFYEERHFAIAPEHNVLVSYLGQETTFGRKQVFVDSSYPRLKIGVELCEDLWVPSSPSSILALHGASVILNLSSSNEIVGKADYRRRLVSMASAKEAAAYVYADSGDGESTSDLVFAGHNIIAENGRIIAESRLFSMKSAVADIDLELLSAERKRMNSFVPTGEEFHYVPFDLELRLPSNLLRKYGQSPFIPEGEMDFERVNAILDMQAEGLKNRLRAIHCAKAVIGLSGGLDSTLALLVAHRAFKLAGLDPKGLLAITLPCFGTSSRTHDNAVKLAKSLGVSFREINIARSVESHLKDIGHGSSLNVAFENAQARERTQVLMDIANDIGAIMVGTGDLSELCLGWCTYNGDHMSMYGVNASIPKTLVRYLVKGYSMMYKECSEALDDILDTPISPELLPTDSNGQIAQKTEDKIGPYDLHDFFIFYYLRYRFRPAKLYLIACLAFEGRFDKATIKKWLVAFFRRYFSNQFKRNCLPDGAKVGTVAISPRGDLRLPSDVDADSYLREAESL